MRNIMRVIAAALVVTFGVTAGLAACAPTSDFKNAPTDASISADLKPFYEQSVAWRGCGDKKYCAEIKVPLDWANPARDSIKIAVIYAEATGGSPIGSLLMNPGGPGASGFDYVNDSIESIGSPELRAKYNIVGFDPRGVGRSQGIKCFDTADMDDLLYGDSGLPLGSKADIAETRAKIATFADACKKNSGEVLGFVDTVSAARDMDIIRTVFGEEKLNYLGFSYGTFLGTTYAALYPEKVGRMVLDGAIDPNVGDEQQSINQLVGFDQALRAYVSNCLGSADCPFSGSVEQSMLGIAKFLRSLEGNPLATTGDRELTVWAAVTGIIMPLYSQDYWSYLTQAFTEAFAGDGTTLLQLADFYNDRIDGKYASNMTEANIAVSCLDSRSDASPQAMAKQNERVLATSVALGRYWQFGGLTCEQWPYPVAKPPASYAAKGSPTILVIGTTGDPATPYSQAKSLVSEVLDNAFLLTYNGEGHTAYGRSNACVDGTVDDFLLMGRLPKADPNC